MRSRWSLITWNIIGIVFMIAWWIGIPILFYARLAHRIDEKFHESELDRNSLRAMISALAEVDESSKALAGKNVELLTLAITQIANNQRDIAVALAQQAEVQKDLHEYVQQRK